MIYQHTPCPGLGVKISTYTLKDTQISSEGICCEFNLILSLVASIFAVIFINLCFTGHAGIKKMKG